MVSHVDSLATCDVLYVLVGIKSKGSSALVFLIIVLYRYTDAGGFIAAAAAEIPVAHLGEGCLTTLPVSVIPTFMISTPVLDVMITPSNSIAH